MLALLINFSNFKLPHYMPILTPFMAIIVAAFFVSRSGNEKWERPLFILQVIVSVCLLLLAALVNAWAFPVHQLLILIGTILLLALVFYFFLSRSFTSIRKAITVTVSAIALLFFLLNTNFYPQLLDYQAGKPMADLTRGIADPKNVYYWKNTFSSSYNFYSASLRQVYDDSIKQSGKKFWLIYDRSQRPEIDSLGLIFGKEFSVNDYEITRLKNFFMDPATRNETLTEMVMAEVVGWK